jgi:hypothetical protein
MGIFYAQSNNVNTRKDALSAVCFSRFSICANSVNILGIVSSIRSIRVISSLSGVEPSPLVLRPLIEPFYQLWMICDDINRGTIAGMNDWQGN